MTVFYILLTSLVNAASANSIRIIQAFATDAYRSVGVSYVVALLIAVAWCAIRGFSVNLAVVLCGLYSGVFYTAALLMIIRTMGQRGMSVTLAVVALSQIVPVLVAIAFGDRPGPFQAVGIVAAMVALPPLAVATAKGLRISQPPRLATVVALFLLQGAAMTGNLLANRFVERGGYPAYVAILFATGGTLTAILLATGGRAKSAGNARNMSTGALFGLLNVGSTILMLLALTKVAGSLFYALSGPLVLVCSTVIALVFWRERMGIQGFVGIAIALCAVIFLAIPS